MFPFPALFTSEMAVILFAVGVKCSSVAQERVNLTIVSQIIEESVNGGKAYFIVFLGNFMIQFFGVEERIK